MGIRIAGWVLGGGMVALGAAPGYAAVIGDTLGDTTPRTIYKSGDGSSQSLSELLWNYKDPVTGLSSRITAPDGSRLRMGDVSRGEDPLTSQQLLYQRFLMMDQDASLKLTFMGGLAGYKNMIGYYTYPTALEPDTASLTLQPLFTQHVDPVGTSVTFSVSKDHALGLFLNADGGRGSSKGVFYTENFRNSDVIQGPNPLTPDHFVMYQTNKGLLIAAEDIKYSQGTGRMGDQDYNDVIVGLLTYADGTPLIPIPHGSIVPEPASLGLLVLGTLLAWRRKR